MRCSCSARSGSTLPVLVAGVVLEFRVGRVWLTSLLPELQPLYQFVKIEAGPETTARKGA